MDISIIYKNLLKVFVICLSVVCLNVTRVAAESGLGLSPEMQAVRTWFEQKMQTLKIQHPTAEEKRQIEAAKKEWDEKSKTMTDDEYQAAYEAWDDSSSAAWAKLNPATSSDADVIAADSADYVLSEVEVYARYLGGQVKPESKKESEPNVEESLEEVATDGTETSPTYGDEQIPTEVPVTVTQTVTQNKDGKITQETTSNSVKGGAGGASVPTADEGDGVKTDDVKVEDKNKEEDKKEDEKKEAEYTGIYKDHQLIPDAMATHCEMNAEDVVKDMSRLEGCIRRYITEMNNDNALDASDGKKIFNVLRFNVLSDAMKKGIAKAAAVNGYEDAMNNYAEASANAETKFDSEANISNTLAFATDVQNSIRDLYVESLRIEAVNGFEEVDPSAFADEEKSEKAKTVEEKEGKSVSNLTTVETTVQVGEEDAVDGGELAETNVTGNANAKEYISKFREMSDSKLAQQKAQYESILNDSAATEDMKKEAENMLRYVEYIEEERKGGEQ